MADMRRTTALALCLALAAALFLAPVPPLEAASSRDKFLSAWKDFHALVKNERKGKYRSFWLDLEKRFMDVYKRAPGSSDAPKALYYAARANEELGKRSYLRSDFQKSVAYYERVLSRFPSHGWADDCLYRKAYIEWKYLKDPDRAVADLDRLLKEHPKGDMVANARKLRREIPGNEIAASPKHTEKPTSTSTLKGRVNNRLLKIRHQSSDDYTRIVLDLDKEAHFRFQMLNPDQKLGETLPFVCGSGRDARGGWGGAGGDGGRRHPAPGPLGPVSDGYHAGGARFPGFAEIQRLRLGQPLPHRH